MAIRFRTPYGNQTPIFDCETLVSLDCRSMCWAEERNSVHSTCQMRKSLFTPMLFRWIVTVCNHRKTDGSHEFPDGGSIHCNTQNLSASTSYIYLGTFMFLLHALQFMLLYLIQYFHFCKVLHGTACPSVHGTRCTWIILNIWNIQWNLKNPSIQPVQKFCLTIQNSGLLRSIILIHKIITKTK